MPKSKFDSLLKGSPAKKGGDAFSMVRADGTETGSIHYQWVDEIEANLSDEYKAKRKAATKKLLLESGADEELAERMSG